VHAAFLCLRFWFVLYLHKPNGAKAAHRTWMKTNQAQFELFGLLSSFLYCHLFPTMIEGCKKSKVEKENLRIKKPTFFFSSFSFLHKKQVR
jgi:hypothetical protein